MLRAMKSGLPRYYHMEHFVSVFLVCKKMRCFELGLYCTKSGRFALFYILLITHKLVKNSGFIVVIKYFITSIIFTISGQFICLRFKCLLHQYYPLPRLCSLIDSVDLTFTQYCHFQ